MLKLKLLATVLFTVLLMSASYKSEAFHKDFDFWATDVNGVSHHFHGWVEGSIIPPSIDHGDVWIDDSHFKFGIKQGSGTNPNPNGFAFAQNLNDVTNYYDVTLTDINGNPLSVIANANGTIEAYNEAVEVAESGN
jgi:hypothetical protein